MWLPIKKWNSFVIMLTYPTPSSMSTYMFKIGSLLIAVYTMQLLTGLFLSMHYTASIFAAFDSVDFINREVNFGWLMRYIHANGASLFFIFLYLHMGKGLYYSSYMRKHLWASGMTLYILVMAISFLGYVLVWGQMSFWGAAVITNFFSSIPYIGDMLVNWIWGGYVVDDPTLHRFYTFHFLFPFILAVFILAHIIILHIEGNTNPLGTSVKNQSMSFNPLLPLSDMFILLVAFFIFSFLIFFSPLLLGEPENFIEANPMVVPEHIKPEWYFLWMYALLRAIPNKLGGVSLVFGTLFLFYFLNILLPKFPNRNIEFKPLAPFFFWIFVCSFISLTWLGGRPPEEPFSFVVWPTMILFYFSLYLMLIF